MFDIIFITDPKQRFKNLVDCIRGWNEHLVIYPVARNCGHDLMYEGLRDYVGKYDAELMGKIEVLRQAYLDVIEHVKSKG